MRFSLDTRDLEVNIVKTIVAGWTGRDRAGVEHHIEELSELGVAPPSTVPLFYRVSSQLLTQAAEIEVMGPNTSGEVEPMIIATRQEIFLGLASDHTDRALEAASVAASKQACPKPLATRLWRFRGVEERIDDLEIRSWIWEADTWVPYQKGLLANIRPLGKLMEAAAIETGGLAADEAIAMLCGTCPVISGGIRPASRFRMSICNPANGAEITHHYHSKALPAVA